MSLICFPLWLFLYHVITSCKGPIDVSFLVSLSLIDDKIKIALHHGKRFGATLVDSQPFDFMT